MLSGQPRERPGAKRSQVGVLLLLDRQALVELGDFLLQPAPWSLTQGWVGFARDELGLDPWLNFYIANGHAYAATLGQQPKALGAGSPPFAATQTTEPWPVPEACG